MRKFFLPLLIFIFLYGCQTFQHKDLSKEKISQEENDLRSVAGSVGGGPLTEEEFKNLKKQAQSNPEAQSAVESIKNSWQKNKQNIKFCPVDGERFSATVTTCPTHGVELKNLQ